jgi:REP element-mobilizing transposase RayT
VEYPERERLPHEVPLWVDPQKEVYYLTINCKRRGQCVLTQPEVSKKVLESVGFRQAKGLWFAHVFLLMPDHVHGLVSFPRSQRTILGVVSDWKRWTSRQLGIEWQEDFFEHRLRNDENAREKADYILANPVRKGLAAQAADWPHVWFGGGWLRTERG